MAHNKQLDTHAVNRLMCDLYEDYINPEERDCRRAWEDSLFELYWPGLGMNHSLLAPEEQEQVEAHIAICRWCTLEKRERMRVMEGGPVVPLNKAALLRFVDEEREREEASAWQRVTRTVQNIHADVSASVFALRERLTRSQPSAFGVLGGGKTSSSAANVKSSVNAVDLPVEMQPYFDSQQMDLTLQEDGSRLRLIVQLPALLDERDESDVYLYTTTYNKKDKKQSDTIKKLIVPGRRSVIELPKETQSCEVQIEYTPAESEALENDALEDW